MNISLMKCTILFTDFYKIGHVIQYPPDVTQVWINQTARSSRVDGQTSVIHFGTQYLIKEYLIKRFNEGFFNIPLDEVLEVYKAVMLNCLGVTNPKTDHIEFLHKLGYLPIDIWSLPEGSSVPLGVPMIVMTNTVPECFWLPNYLETLCSLAMWKPTTSATTAKRFHDIMTKWAVKAGEKDLSFIQWQGHDFSMRGMSGLEDAIISGMGHLTSFSGTDTIPAILAASEYYNAPLNCGGSINATEHSVMCAGGKEDEFETYRRLLCDVYPEGNLSLVSDTWDLWAVCTDYMVRLKDVILRRKGKDITRPDSGDPVKIICGDPAFKDVLHKYNWPRHPAEDGVLKILTQVMGTVPGGGDLPMINNAGAVYGDSINEERCDAILKFCVDDYKISPFNMVFGIGSFTYEYRTRDTYGFAWKATAVRRNGQIIDIFKNPVTDDGGKRSHKGIPAVYTNTVSYELYCVQGAAPEDLDNCAFQKVFSNGKLLIETDLDTIRKRVKGI